MNCKDCNKELNALTMSDVDEKYCGECAYKRVEILLSSIEKTTLVLWENKS